MTPAEQSKMNQAGQLLHEAYRHRYQNLAKSLELAGLALQIARQLQTPDLLAKCQMQLSLFHLMLGEHEEAIQYAEEAVINSGSGDASPLTETLVAQAEFETMKHLLDGRKALLAEDNPVNALTAQVLLTRYGVSTELATNGKEALAKAQQQPFDFILMDLHMPLMNGFEATMQIRQQKNPNSQKPVFALTADITAEQHDDFVSYFNGFLWKPLQVQRLYEALLATGK